MSLLLYPAAFMANTFAMMLVMIGLSLFGEPALAADFGLVHGATVALFYAFSGNARSLILADSRGGVGAASILRLRLMILLPLSILAFMLCIGVVDGGWPFVLILVVRRAAEWLAEIFLSEQELRHQGSAALRFFLIQGCLSLALLLALLDGGTLAMPVTFLWGVSPLIGCLSLGLLGSALRNSIPLLSNVRQLLPHFGSTAVIGVSVYLFRLFILLVAGKQVAGDLFSAFALGGILGSIFSQALGPTLVRHEQRSPSAWRLGRLFNLMLLGVLLLGTFLVALVWGLPQVLDWTTKGQFFWLAVGCSLVGGVIMVVAQRIRLRIIQGNSGGDVFGSDVLANLLLVGCVPLLFYGFGVEFFAILYLLGALLSLIFYASEDKGFFDEGEGMFRIKSRGPLLVLVLLLFLPVFFQLENGIYRGQSSYFSSGGSLALLPIPLSVLACYIGIILLGGFAKVRSSLIVIFLTFMGMLLGTILLASGSDAYERAKIILLAQYMLPMLALVLGQQYGARHGAISSLGLALFWLLMIIVPLQLASTFCKGLTYLSPSLFVFSIYQHLQYVPTLFVGAFLIALYALWEQPRMHLLLLFLTALMGVYASVSVSMLTMGLFFMGIVFFAARFLISGIARHRVMLVFFLAVGSLFLGLAYKANADILAEKFGVAGQGFLGGAEGGPKNLQERLFYWRFYLGGIAESGYSLLLGHLQAPDRKLYPSAHNYYFDFVYNFGLIAILPIFYLLALTLCQVLASLKAVWSSPAVLGVAGVVVFLLLADNFFKVGMRQPYPGIITFFLWGVLLACLQRIGGTHSPESRASLAATGKVE